MVKITLAELADCEAIIQLQQLAYQTEAQLYQDWAIPPLTQTVHSLQQEFPHLVMLKAVSDKKIIGSVRARLIDGACHIGRLIVHPDFQKQGLGSELLLRIEQAFPDAVVYELFTGSKSEGNIKFYLANHYQPAYTKNISANLSLVYLRKTAS